MKRITQKAIKEESKGECIIMGDFNHGYIQWKFLESTEVRINCFYFYSLYLTRAKTNQGENVLNSWTISKYMNHWVTVIIIKYILLCMHNKTYERRLDH